MNREIKFRAWDEKSGQMLQSTSKNLSTFFTMYNEFQEFANHFGTRIILMQFTGLRDITGRDVYEGDIIARTTIPDRIVEWDSDDCCWVTRKISTGNICRIDIDYFDVVIGNIHQNPELL